MPARIIALLLVVVMLWSLGAAMTEANGMLVAEVGEARTDLSPVLELDTDRDRSVEPQPGDRALPAYAEVVGDLPALLPVCYTGPASPARATPSIVASTRCRPPPYLDGPRRPPRRAILAP